MTRRDRLTALTLRLRDKAAATGRRDEQRLTLGPRDVRLVLSEIERRKG